MGISVIIEGPEGAGKTTQSTLVELFFKETNFPVEKKREPGGTKFGEVLRHMVLGSEYAKDLEPLTYLFMYSGARVELQEKVVKPFLEKNPTGVFIRDRGWPSTMALQFADGVPYDYLSIVQAPFKNFRDLIFVIDIHEEESQVRIGIQKKLNSTTLHWRDEVPLETYQIIRNQYFRVAEEFRRERFVIIDGFKSPWEITGQISNEILRRLSEKEETKKEAENLLDRFPEVFQSFKEKIGNRVDMEKQAALEAEVRQELGIAEKEVLRSEMLRDWSGWGIVEGSFRGKERR